MKKLPMLTCLTLLTVGIASAQILNFTSKAPFSAGNSSFPAGSYQIHAADQEQMIFECTSDVKGHSALFEVDSQDTVPTTTGVTFAKYGDKLILKSFSICRSGCVVGSNFAGRKTGQKDGRKAG